MTDNVDMATIQADFDQLALVVRDGWNHNNHYHDFLLCKESEAARKAWAEHGKHDTYLTLAQLREICKKVLPGVKVKRHLLWRYSLTWRKKPDA